jgi:hypothetical protein
MKTLIDIDHEMQSHEMTLSGMHQQLIRDQPVVSSVHIHESYGIDVEQEGAIHLYEKEVGKRIEEFHDKTTRKKYGSHEQYVQFKQGVFVCCPLIRGVF